MTSPTTGIAAPARHTEFDLTDVDLFADERHHDVFARLRAERPVYWNPTIDGDGFWSLTTYDDVAAAYQDHTSLSSAGGAMMGGSFRNEADTGSGRMLVASDPPWHRLLRAAMHKLFAGTVIDRVRTEVRGLVARALERLHSDGGQDLATDLTLELPAGALMAMLRIPHPDAHHLITLTRKMIGYRDPRLAGGPDDDDRLRLVSIQAEMFEFFADLMTERARVPGDDVVSVLMGTRINGRLLTEEEVIYNCVNVAVGGNETTSYSACSGIVELIKTNGFEAVAANPNLVDPAINEILRWSSTNAYVKRVALRDVQFSGTRISAGQAVALWNVSANRDERQFADAGRFDIERSPNRHLAYGSGVHRCIGAMLAHAELTVLLEAFRAFPARLAIDGEVTRLKSNFILGVTSLPVRVEGR